MKSVGCISFFTLFFLASQTSLAEDYVQRQIKATVKRTLSNGIQVIQREENGSNIAHFEILFGKGQVDLEEEHRAINGVIFDAIPFGSKKYSKEKVYALTEKHSVAISCDGGIELSGCQFETISNNFEVAFDVFSSLVLEPLFDEEDLVLVKQRRTAMYQQDQQNPEQRVNSLLNSVFYPVGHPYRHLPEDGIAQLSGVTQTMVSSHYRDILDAGAMTIIYVGPQLTPKQWHRVDSSFSGVKAKRQSRRMIDEPLLQKDKRMVFESREIPTAYIRLKFNAPGVTSVDAPVSKLLFEMLAEILHEEIRTKRSLSYAIHAATIQLQAGIGIISASTSKPKETLEAIADVIKNVKSKPLTNEQLNEYKNVFTTTHFLTLESHDSFASILGQASFYKNDPFDAYRYPAKISGVTAEQIARLASSILTNMRVGVIYDEKKFDKAWIEPVLAL